MKDRAQSRVVICELKTVPAGFDSMLRASCEEGYGFLTRLKEQWDQFENRFDKPGECLVGAFSGNGLIGIGGLNIDPYCTKEISVGRLRHVYVTVGHRRSGVGKLLVTRLLHQAQREFRVVRLRVADEIGARFYESAGFAPVSDDNASHIYGFTEDE